MASCKYKSTGRNLGVGLYSNVKEVELKGFNQPLALKIFDNSISRPQYSVFNPVIIKDAFQREKKYTTLDNPTEIDILFRLKSPNLLSGFRNENDIGIVEFAECDYNAPGVVTFRIERNLFRDLPALNFYEKKMIMKGLAKGLKCLHQNNYLHLDMKLKNCMYNAVERGGKKIYDGVIIDFGSSTYVKGDIEKGIFTQQPRMEASYRPPESLTEYKNQTYYYNNKSDIWGLGTIFYQILTNNVNFFPDSIYEQLEENNFDGLSEFYSAIMNINTIGKFLDISIIPVASEINPIIQTEDNQIQLKNLLQGMLNISPGLRSNIDQVLAHPFFNTSANDDSCKVQLIKNVSLDKMEKKYFEGIYEIIDYCESKLFDKNVVVFFMAVDLFLRYFTKKETFLINLPKICCLAALKYYYWSELKELTIDQYIDMTSDEFILNEVRLYKTLNGKINEERYFSNAKSHIELFEVYKNMIYPYREDVELKIKDGLTINKNILNYLNQDGKKFINSFDLKDKDDLSRITIDKFFNT
jgi:serine/threonine protein kinase